MQLQAIRKDTRDFSFKGQKAVFNKQIRTTTGLYTSEQYVKNRVSSPLAAWKKDYVDAGERNAAGHLTQSRQVAP